MSRVRFDKIDTIWYYNQTECADAQDWMQHARDRCRFQMRVKRTEDVLRKVLEQKVANYPHTLKNKMHS